MLSYDSMNSKLMINVFVGLHIIVPENKGWELCDEAEVHATEWYEYKSEDLHFQGLTDNVEEQNKSI